MRSHVMWWLGGALTCALVLSASSPAQAGRKDVSPAPIGVNVGLNVPATADILDQLGAYGTVLTVFEQIDAVTLRTSADALEAIAALPFVDAVNPDAERDTGPSDANGLPDWLAYGYSTWNLDAINVTDIGPSNRVVAENGSGVYVAVLDTGLVDDWRSYFPAERIATEYAIAFQGGGQDRGAVAATPNLWEHDVNSHGTHVTSTILGYVLWQANGGVLINGVAPQATVIPVKVLNQNGSGWSSMIAMGLIYVAELKRGPLADHPVVVNMSLGGSRLDVIEKMAIDYAIAQGVIIVASAGNSGLRGMGYPGGYAPVISVAASGWAGQWTNPYWWYAGNVSDPINPAEFYIADFSSRARSYQDLDVTAPGAWVVGPYQVNRGHLGYYFLSGTSMASPHVAGVVALMAQKAPGLTAAAAEQVLEGSAVGLEPGCRAAYEPAGNVAMHCWGADATGAGLVDAQAALDALD